MLYFVLNKEKKIHGKDGRMVTIFPSWFIPRGPLHNPTQISEWKLKSYAFWEKTKKQKNPKCQKYKITASWKSALQF